MRGIDLTQKNNDQGVDLSRKLGIPIEQVAAALALAEDLRVVQILISLPAQTARASESSIRGTRADCKIDGKLSRRITMTTTKQRASPHSPAELVVMLLLYHLTMFLSEIVEFSFSSHRNPASKQ